MVLVERTAGDERRAGFYGHEELHRAALAGHIDSVRRVAAAAVGTAAADKAAVDRVAVDKTAVDIGFAGRKAVGTVGLGGAIAADQAEEAEAVCCRPAVTEGRGNVRRRAVGRRSEDRAAEWRDFPAGWETGIGCQAAGDCTTAGRRSMP